MKNSLLTFLFILSGGLLSCGSDDPTTEIDNYDRKAMLANWADNIILPGYNIYLNELSKLDQAVEAFTAAPDMDGMNSLRNSWLDAYMAWQKVSMFEIGPAEASTLRDFTNIFPTDTQLIEQHIANPSYNLELPSTRAAQGFPALDYLLYGSAASDTEIVQRYQSESALRDYLSLLVKRLNQLTSDVVETWENGYRDTFVNNDGSSASSSVNKLTNDFMFYYEKALRAGKIGIPAGVFSNSPLSDRVEGLYSRTYSRDLFLTSLQASKDFFNGIYYDGNSQGQSLKSYLDFMNSVSNGENLGDLINNQLDSALRQGNMLGADLFEEVETSNVNMLRTYDELQKNVILMKVDMFQALSIQVDFVDADGD